MSITIATLCSGIGVPEKVFFGDNYKTLFCAENDKFASAVLLHRYPQLPNLGDIQKIDGRKWEGKINILIGGPPCQAFSSIGKRESLSDPRGLLTLDYVRLLREIAPAIAIYENVPKILGAKLNPWGRFLAEITGDNEPLRPNSQPARDGDAVKWPNSGVVFGGGKAIAWTVLDSQDFGVPQRRKRVWAVIADTRKLGRMVGAPPDFDTNRLRTIPAEILLDPSSQRRSPATRKTQNPAAAGTSFAIGFSANDRGGDAGIELCPTIRSGNHVTSWANSTGGGTAVAICDAAGGWTVRYLTPNECERAFGLPINYTQIPWGGQPTAPDGNRKTVLGNTMAVPCLEHIKLRIETVIKDYVEFFKHERQKNMAELLIDPELRNFIPALQPEEFQLLKKSILQNGCSSPIIVWKEKNTIVDGHNRYKICTENNIEYKVSYQSFPDKDSVKIWMGANQLGQRNLNDHSRTYLTGKLLSLLSKRKSGGRFQGEGYTNAQLQQILNVKSHRTIQQAGKYYEAIEQITAVRPEIHKEIEAGEIALNRLEVLAIGNLVELDRELAKDFLETPKIPDKRQQTPAFKESCRQVRQFLNEKYPTLEEQKKIARDPKQWAEFKVASDITMKFDGGAWAEVGNEIRREQIQKKFTSRQEELEQRGAELGLPKNFTSVLAKSWLEKQKTKEPPPPQDKTLEYKILPVNLSNYSDAEIDRAIARLKQEQERRKNVTNNLNIAA